MKKFIIKVILFVSLLFVLLTVPFLFWIAPQYTQNYNASIIDKIERLQTIESPKIILVGNSNLAFGIKSENIEKAMGMPVVNLGLHGGLGNKFHIEMAKYNIDKGDLVVVCHSNYADSGKIGDPALAWITIENHWNLYPLIEYDLKGMALYYPKYISKGLKSYLNKEDKPQTNTCYTRSAFNKYGDINYPRATNSYTFTKTSVGVPAINSICINHLNEFNKYCNELGATLLIAGYPIGDGEFTPDKKIFIDSWEQLKQQVDCNVISNIEDYFIEYKYFYNTNLHLTDEGAKIRTNQLIEDLQNYIENN